MPERVAVEGLDELRAALRKLGSVERSKEFKEGGYRAGNEVIVPGAQQRARTPLEQRAAETVKAARVGSGGAVRFGAGFAGAMGAEFGAHHDVLRNTARGPMVGWNQFPEVTPGGRFLWPTISDESDRIVAIIDEALDPLFRVAFPDRYGGLGILSHVGR